MDIKVSIVVTIVFLVIWISALIGEYVLFKKKRRKPAKKPQHEEERSGVYFGDRGYNDDRYKHF